MQFIQSLSNFHSLIRECHFLFHSYYIYIICIFIFKKKKTINEYRIDRVLTPGLRCTVMLDTKVYDSPGKQIKGIVVSPTAPREDTGTYWGYTTRIASSINAIFENSPYGAYDLKIGTSERGDTIIDDSNFKIPSYKHSLIVFGGVAGIEECIDADESMTISGENSKSLFDIWYVHTLSLY